MSKPKKTYSFKLHEFHVETLRDMGVDITHEFTKLMDKLSKSKACPTCGTVIRKGRGK